ncbi:hypothetical protein XHV734_2975 [Xanthomonas hortorum pv. vitians]|nr:hypothetical protein XHV734_2975 [Xanthomonas hortorum pv. vitians]
MSEQSHASDANKHGNRCTVFSSLFDTVIREAGTNKATSTAASGRLSPQRLATLSWDSPGQK